MLSNTHPGALQQSGWETLGCSPFVAVNQIFGIKRCLIFCHYAFILILHNEAMHQDEMVYLGITLAFLTDSWGGGPHTVFLCSQNAVTNEKRGVKLYDLYWIRSALSPRLTWPSGGFLTTRLLINILKNLNQKFDERHPLPMSLWSWNETCFSD